MTAPLSKQHLTYLRSKLDDGLSSLDAKIALRILDELQEADEAVTRLTGLLERYERSGASQDAKALACKVGAILEPTSTWKRNAAAREKPQRASTWGT